jgi:DNA-binding CsgD family transcriptional regulator
MPDLQPTVATDTPRLIVSRRLRELSLTEQDIIDWIATDDLSIPSIAVRLGVSSSSVWQWLQAVPTRQAQAREARLQSADALLDKALAAIDAIPEDGTHAQIAKGRERRAHFERRAAIRNPKYSDRVQVDATVRDERDLSQLSDAELIELARKAGVSGPVIEGYAE